MFNPADITPENIQKLAQKMQDPAARKQAAFMLAQNIGPAPDEQDQIQQMVNPQGGPPQGQANPGAFPGQGQIPQSGMVPVPTPQQATPPAIQQEQQQMLMQQQQEQQMIQEQAAQQQAQKMAEAQEYDNLGLTGAAPDDIWGKAAIYNDFILQQQAAQRQLQMQVDPQGAGQQQPSAPMIQTEPLPSRQAPPSTVPDENFRQLFKF